MDTALRTQLDPIWAFANHLTRLREGGRTVVQHPSVRAGKTVHDLAECPGDARKRSEMGRRPGPDVQYGRGGGRLCVLTSRHRHACIVVARAGIPGLPDAHPSAGPVHLGVPAKFPGGWEASQAMMARLSGAPRPRRTGALPESPQCRIRLMAQLVRRRTSLKHGAAFGGRRRR